MTDCKSLIHPFQYDPGTSQHERVMNDLLSGDAKIDARTLAELLNYFTRFASQVTYYDSNLVTSDWRPFFSKSLTFGLASVIKYDAGTVEDKMNFYNLLFSRKPSRAGLQLYIHYFFHQAIQPFLKWSGLVKDSGLGIETLLAKLIKEKLQAPLKQFIIFMNIAVKWYDVKRVDMTEFVNDESWDLDMTDIYIVDESVVSDTIGEINKLIKLQAAIKDLFSSFIESVKLLTSSSETADSLSQSLLPLKEELRQRHPPHLALLFTFLKMFRQLMDDLNGFTRKHLDFFYINVLKLKPKDAVPDQLHVLFEIQTQLKKYALNKGLLVKDGKDNNKEEILFALDDNIVVNKTQVADVRTLFVNNQVVNEKMYVEGVYMAPKAAKADGVEKDFKDPGPKNYPTLGAKYSKYTEPEKTEPKAYPDARIGFVLASNVLMMKEGNRQVDITINCSLNDNCEPTNTSSVDDEPCCGQSTKPRSGDGSCDPQPDFIQMSVLYPLVKKFIASTYYVITEDLIRLAVSMGLKDDTAGKIRNTYLLDQCRESLCCDQKKFVPVISVKKKHWEKFLTKLNSSIGDVTILQSLFKEQSPFTIQFSGEKDWVFPLAPAITGITGATSNSIILTISATIVTGQPAITFYNKDNLKEDLGTELPLVKIELNNNISIPLNKKLRKKLGLQKSDNDCCLLPETMNCRSRIALYEFFRKYNVEAGTKIDVTVCGMTQFLAKNDEGLLDINSPFPPFGARPVLGSNFYIGSSEIFFKNWSQCWVNISWKNRPDDLTAYYQGYQNGLSNPKILITDFTNTNFFVQKAISNKNTWLDPAANPVDNLLPAPGASLSLTSLCGQRFDTQFSLSRSDYAYEIIKNEQLESLTKEFNINSKNGFTRFTLHGIVDFQHNNYSFILGRQMTALGKLPKDIVDGAIYYDSVPANIKVVSTDDLLKKYQDAQPLSDVIFIREQTLESNAVIDGAGNITDALPNKNSSTIINALTGPESAAINTWNLHHASDELKKRIDAGVTDLNNISHYAAIIPNAPWTPLISNITLDYKATAGLPDIEMIHLYPYSGTYKHVEIQAEPSLFPVFCDEGNLFIGLKDLVPGSNLNLLFQLAEATADSEANREKLHWYFLAANEWKPLRIGFELLDDASYGLTRSGVIKFSLPGNISIGNTIMPKEFYWIRASIVMNSVATSETIGIHAQAMLAVFTNTNANDKLRLSKPLPAESVATLNQADAAVKKVSQPYDSFGGSVPGSGGSFYVRVSELLRHKGRAIQKFDYERLVLEAFPELFKTKCINHSFGLNAHQYINDYPMAPGYVIIAVIPDLNKLQAGQSFEPKVPVSILEKVQEYLQRRNSPFARLRVMNPRYERIYFCLTAKLKYGYDENYYKEKIKQDLREFLAPWAVGENDKLDFGQQVNRSDIIGFLDGKNYMDYIANLEMAHESSLGTIETIISPKTPRSILIAGDIKVCVLSNPCEQWGEGMCEAPATPMIDYCNKKQNR